MSRQLFGTDGIRARAGVYPLNPSTINEIGRSLVRLGKKKILLGRDTRISGVWIEQVLCQGIGEEGGEAILAGVLTTPGVAYLTRTQNCDAGVVISASHNAFQDNGIKVFSAGGMKLTDGEEERIEELMDKSEAGDVPGDSSTEVDRARLEKFDPSLVSGYIAFLKSRPSCDLSGLKIVLDCANGASFYVAPRVFEQLGVDVVTLNNHPDGSNINLRCGSLHPGQMVEAVVESGADFGVAFDGDSDRSIVADASGKVADGDHILYLLARYLQSRGRLSSDTIVSTVMANFGLEEALHQAGLKLKRTAVGDRYVLEEMLKGGHALGGEQSGHVIVREHSLAGDGILTALLVAEAVAAEQKSLQELIQPVEKYPQVLFNVPVREKRNFTEIAPIQDEIERVEGDLRGRGRVLVRYSGTEPLARVMVEGPAMAEIEQHAQAIAQRFERELG